MNNRASQQNMNVQGKGYEISTQQSNQFNFYKNRTVGGCINNSMSDNMSVKSV